MRVREATLAPGIIGEALDDGPGRVGNRRDRAEMVLVEISRVSCGVGAIDPHGDHFAASGERGNCQLITSHLSVRR